MNTHIISTLNWTASNTIIEILLKQSDFKAEELKYKEYNTLCSLLTNNNYKGCLIELCDNLWSIMKNYYRMFMWHETSTNTNDEIKKKFNQGLQMNVFLTLFVLAKILDKRHVSLTIKLDNFLNNSSY